MNCKLLDYIARQRAVSIHIRHCWRMNSCVVQPVSDCCLSFNPHSPLLANELCPHRRRSAASNCFNPHSPLLANELPRLTGRRRAAPVSIHIRHCWRMNFGAGNLAAQLGIVSIHIRHCWRMNCDNGSRLDLRREFQSTFAIAGE